MRYAVDGDSIWNGADDNATVSVAHARDRARVREAAGRRGRRCSSGTARRSADCSARYWFAAHPMVPLQQIVAVLNGDMIGRNNPDSAALLGAQPPHRNSHGAGEHGARREQRADASS